MEEKVIINSDLTSSYLPAISAAITFKDNKGAQPTTVLPKLTSAGDVSFWGDDNLFPQTVISDVAASTIVQPVLEWKAKALYSGGLVYGSLQVDETGKETLKRIIDPEIEDFFKKTLINRYLIEACNDFYWFYNGFNEIILTKDRSKIVALTSQEATYSRWAKRNTSTGQIEKCYINANWDNGGTVENSISVPVIDPYFDAVENLRSGKEYKYIYPTFYPTPGKSYYQLAGWNSLRESGWLEFAKSIPLFKKNLMKNQISIKYHIEVAQDWWSWKYPDFTSFDAKKKKETMEAELSTFNDLMVGHEKTGKSIMSTFKTDPHTGKEYVGWRIQAIDDKIKDGIYIEDSQEASSHHFSALGVDPTLIGISPGKGMGAGSGSDKRVAFNIYIANTKAEQDLILEPIDFIAQYNNWTSRIPGLTFWFKSYWIATLDQGSGIQQQSQPSNKPA